jgi:hypothetical protein
MACLDAHLYEIEYILMSDLNSIRGTETACPCQILCVTNALLADSNLILFAFSLKCLNYYLLNIFISSKLFKKQIFLDSNV